MAFLAAAGLSLLLCGQNLIENGDFENGVSQWKVPGWKSSWLVPAHDKANSQGMGGTGSMRMDWTNKHTFYVIYHKEVKIPAGLKELEISFWTKSKGYENSTKGIFNLAVEFPELKKKKGWSNGISTPWNKTQPEWTLFEKKIPIPDGVTKMKFTMRIHGSKNKSGTTWVDNVYIGPVRIKAKEAVQEKKIVLTRGIPLCDHGGVYYPGEPITYSYEFKENKIAGKTLDFSWQVNDYDGKKVVSGTQKVTFPGTAAGTFHLKLPDLKNFRGWFALKGKLSENGLTVADVTSSGMVLEKQVGRRDPFFTAKGAGSYERQIRMGNGSISFFIQRRFVQTGPTSYSEKHMNRLEQQLKDCERLGFEPFFQFYISQALNLKSNPKQPKYLFDKVNEKLAKGIDPYDEEYYKTWQHMFATFYQRFGKRVTDWYIADEIYHSYSLSKYEIPHYIAVLKLLHQEVKKKDPSKMIGGGNTFMDRDPIGKKMWPSVKDYVDGLVCSLYLGSTTAGKGLNVTSPEQWGLLNSFAGTRAVIGKDKFISSTESGYSFIDYPAIDGDITKNVATIVARNMVLLKTLGVRKWTYFTFINDGMYESKKWGYGRIDYGMWNKATGCPKPHAAAWAVSARMLAFVENPINASPHGDVYCYVFKKGNKTLAAFWAFNKDGVEAVIDMPAPWSGVDFVGRPLKGKAGKQRMTLNEQVRYLEFDAPQEVVAKAFRNGRYLLPEAYVTLTRENGDMVSIYLLNKTSKELTGTATLNNLPAKKFKVPASKLSKVFFRCPPGSGKLNAKAQINGLTYSISKDDEWYGVMRLATAPSIQNGQLKGFEKATPLVMDSVKHLMPDNADGHGFWNGKEDLSAKIYLGYDKNYFYLAADVTDDVNVIRNYGINAWNQDSIQFGFDTANNAFDTVLFPGGYDGDDREFIISGTPRGPELFCYTGTPDIERKNLEKPQVVRVGTRTLYLGRIPWSALGHLKGKPGTVFGFNLVVFDTDNPKGSLACHMDFSKGITYRKAPAMFKRFILK